MAHAEKSGQTQPGPNTVEHELHAGFDNDVKPHSGNTDFFVWSFPAPFGSTAMLKFSNSSLPVVRESHVNLLQLFVSEEKLGGRVKEEQQQQQQQQTKEGTLTRLSGSLPVVQEYIRRAQKKKKNPDQNVSELKNHLVRVCVTVFSGL